MSKHVVNFSSGVASWMAAKRVVDQYGTSDVTLLFADTQIEDEDNYRFLTQATQQLGAPLVRIEDGRDPWQVFFDERLMGNSQFDPCSKILKRQLLNRWHEEHCDPADTVIYLGLMWDEVDRLTNTQARLAPWKVEAPLCSAPFLTKREILAEARACGLEPPRLYGMGFPHANCGGFCIKAGQAHFALLLRTMPERYAYHEQREEEFRQFIGRDVAILKERRNGESRPLTLCALRERIEKQMSFDQHDWGGCGCAV